jgi:hypothetical protein
LREPNDDEVANIISWLGAIKDTGEQKLDDLAVFISGLTGLGLPGDLERVFQLLKGVKSFQSYCGDEGLGIAWLHIRDDMYRKITKDEREQLPEDRAGIVAIDVSGVTGFKWLPDLAQGVFQAPESAQISCLVFFRISHAGEGRRIEGHVLLNPCTRNPLSPRSIKLLQEMFPPKIN